MKTKQKRIIQAGDTLYMYVSAESELHIIEVFKFGVNFLCFFDTNCKSHPEDAEWVIEEQLTIDDLLERDQVAYGWTPKEAYANALILCRRKIIASNDEMQSIIKAAKGTGLYKPYTLTTLVDDLHHVKSLAQSPANHHDPYESGDWMAGWEQHGESLSFYLQNFIDHLKEMGIVKA